MGVLALYAPTSVFDLLLSIYSTIQVDKFYTVIYVYHI